MKPEFQSNRLLSVTRSKAKMYEYSVPTEYHITIPRELAQLFSLAIGILGDISARTSFRIDKDDDQPDDDRGELQFSAHFFDAYLKANLSQEIDNYLLLLGSASYYLSGLPGSSSVLVGHIVTEGLELGGSSLERLLLWLLQGDFSELLPAFGGLYGETINLISRQIVDFYRIGVNIESLRQSIDILKSIAHLSGTPRQLLFSDIISALVAKRIENAARSSMPQYSELTFEQWADIFEKPSFIRELWPAQHLLGKQGVYRGKSAVVQMPTSAGKTKATELIIRSAYLSGRADLAVIVAPFRALCQEIKNNFIEAFAGEDVYIDDPSDVLQVDFNMDTFLQAGVRKKLLIVTPEKLTYMLRQSPELAMSIGIIIYDEGHQFDNGKRGITYELLLSSLKSFIPANTQSVLISAVINNADSIGKWLNGNDSEVVKGLNHIPTYRTVAFASWVDRLGRLEFVSQDEPKRGEFFVPRVIEAHELELKGREKKRRIFPNKEDGGSIALYLGIKLVANGSVAVFCGTKRTVTRLCELIVDAHERSLQYVMPSEYSQEEEVSKIHRLHERHLGRDYPVTKSARLGIFAHSGNTPQGIRLAVEYAMQKGLIKFVICTSTLAQGVNLPIRYLIVTSIYQGQELIKTRDFHNLIGRAGRSGMYTEGSILFADPIIYDGRNSTIVRGRLRWSQIETLLDPSNSEICTSTLLSIFHPWQSDNRSSFFPTNVPGLLNAYIVGDLALREMSNSIAELHGFTSSSIDRQIDWKVNILTRVESYLMAYWDYDDPAFADEGAVMLARGTLAYYLADEREKEQLVQIFRALAANIEQKIPTSEKRNAFGKTLYGVNELVEVESWVQENIEFLRNADNSERLLTSVWSILSKNIRNENFHKVEPLDHLLNIAQRWILGDSYGEIFMDAEYNDVRMIAGSQRRRITLENVIEICDNALAFEGTLVIGAIVEVVLLLYGQNYDDLLVGRLRELQKKLRYGLSSPLETVVYEIGFSDRIIASELATILQSGSVSRRSIEGTIIRNDTEVRTLLATFPSYFTDVVLTEIVTRQT